MGGNRWRGGFEARPSTIHAMTRGFILRISVDPTYRRAIAAATLRRWALAVLEHLALPSRTGLDIAITNDQVIRDLNRTYRGLDEATDVLAFPFTDQGAPAPYYDAKSPSAGSAQDFVLPPRATLVLGEIVIAFPYAQEQAKEVGHSVRQELALLLVHGILHLLGYDHLEPEGEREMWAKTQELLAHLSAGSP